MCICWARHCITCSQAKRLAAVAEVPAAPQLHPEDYRCVPTGGVAIGARTLEGVVLNLDLQCRVEVEAERIEAEVKSVLASYGPGNGHVFNLGHGIHPGIEPEKVKVFVDAVHQHSPQYHTK